MDDYDIQHERDILKEFDKMVADFEVKQDPAAEPAASPVEEPTRIFSGSLEELAKEYTAEEHKAEEIPAGAEAAALAAAGAETPVKPSRRAKAKPEKPEKEKKVKTKKTKPKKKKRHIFLKLVLLLFILGLGAAGYGAHYVYNIVKDAPEINPNNIYEMLSENSVMLAANGEFLENIYSGDSLRTNIEYKDLPKNLINAFVATEDKTFWDHHGFNFIRIAGAIKDRLTTGHRIGGTSTLTQQLSRNLYLADIKGERTLERKLFEAYYTVILERSLSKEQILEAYLNTIYLGFNSNGIAAASEAYFSKDVKDLTLLECAILAALPQSPNTYSPMKRIARADAGNLGAIDIITEDDNWITYYNSAGESRVHLVLYLMHEQGLISDYEYNQAKNASIRNCINPGTTVMSAETTSY
ncbi:MAG: transglycosylase domain-containing protein, partial [Firmicutes bacterium]|nr:transglycosylase domain-containing protein [Bacillota bacterium]